MISTPSQIMHTQHGYNAPQPVQQITQNFGSMYKCFKLWFFIEVVYFYHIWFSVFRSTLNIVPQTEELLKKSRLPFGLTLHPFRDMKVVSMYTSTYVIIKISAYFSEFKYYSYLDNRSMPVLSYLY
uniref:Uncharacterized protein n=1 Tax=Heterorhabditis bacteriophora TaxID=37862 RepID=A0A1I7XDU3_HETBA